MPEVDAWTDEERVDAAVEAVNRLIDHYRDVADQPLVRRVDARHLVHFTLIEERPGQERQARHYGRGSGPMYMNQTDIQERLASEVAGRLVAEHPPPFLRTLQLDIHAHMEIGELRQAVVEGAILFEAWIRQSLTSAYRARGLSDEAIREKFQTQRGSPKSVTSLLTQSVKEVIGLDIEQSPTLARWEQARDLRNAIVHGEREDVTLDDAREALNAYVETIGAIQEAQRRAAK